MRSLVVFLGLGLLVYWPIFSIRPLDGDNFYVLAWVHHAPITALWRLDPGIYPEWRPLAYQSIWLEHRLLQLSSVAVHHFVNLALWAACAALIYRIVKHLTQSRSAGFVAALVPFFDRRAVEALTWIVERQTLFACAFGLLAIDIVMRCGDRDVTRRESAAVAAALLASALGKEYGLSFAAVLVVWSVVGMRRDRVLIAATTAIGAYAGLRMIAAGGAIAPYCEEMGFFFTVDEHCLRPASPDSLAQMIYNAAASVTGTFIPGLFAESGAFGFQPGRIGRNLLVTSIAVAGWLAGGRTLRVLSLVIVANGALNFMLYRGRNQLIGMCIVAILVGAGVAWRERDGARAPSARRAALRAVAMAALVVMVLWKAMITHREVEVTAFELLDAEPCDSVWRARPFGAAFVPMVKHRYGLADPNCELD